MKSREGSLLPVGHLDGPMPDPWIRCTEARALDAGRSRIGRWIPARRERPSVSSPWDMAARLIQQDLEQGDAQRNACINVVEPVEQGAPDVVDKRVCRMAWHVQLRHTSEH